jgi:hypothetical protein
MSSRKLKLTAVGVAMVAVADALMAVPALLAARQQSEQWDASQPARRVTVRTLPLAGSNR